MKTNLTGVVFTAICLVLSACGSVKSSYGSEGTQNLSFPDTSKAAENSYTLFLTGGNALSNQSSVISQITSESINNKKGLVLLGNELSVDITSRPDTAFIFSKIRMLDRQFKDLYLVPGHMEWMSGKSVDHAYNVELDNQLRRIKQKGRLLAPRKGCGEPEVVELSDNAVLVLVDSQWAIESANRKGENHAGCDMGNVLQLRMSLKEIIQENAGKHIIIATHHPIYSVGVTGGKYPLSSHLLPLPVLGTLMTGIKSLVASDQHFGHPAYEAYRSAMLLAIDPCKTCVVISGHDESLQYFKKENKHFIIAGSASGVSYAGKSDHADLSLKSKGYVRADIGTNGEMNLHIISVSENGVSQTVRLIQIASPVNSIDDYQEETNSSATGTSVVLQASDKYGDKNFLRGNFYRAAWSQPVEIPVLHLDGYDGGLTPLQLGGGNQTRSLRLENKDGKQYVLRSIDKKVTSVLPVALRGTVAENIVQDGIAASHPYGALVVPRLARAAGIFYTQPSIVYVPHQKALGIYNADIGDGVYLFEERPGGNTSGIQNFGNPEETFNTLDVISMIAESPGHVIDQKAALRARLFDLWLGDWDRHDDQFRWAVFKENGLHVYRPIPRDRDQVFFNNDGVLDYIAARPYFNPALRRFDDKIDYLPGLVWSGKYFDRSFLHQLSREDFVDMATTLQNALTDDVISSAFMDWPKEIDAIDGESIRNDLKVRRNDLVKYAEAYYEHLSKVVFIPATEDHDKITLSALDKNRLQITIVRTAKNSSFTFYERIVNDDETKEVRVFGLGKQDSILVTGEDGPDILIRIIGGPDEDVVINNSNDVRLIVYDDKDGMKVTGRKIRSHLNDKPFNNIYDRTDWKLNKSIHFPLPAYFTDEGFGLSYNLLSTRYGFRSDPYKANHTVALSYFFNTGGFIGQYKGLWPHAIGELDFGIDVYFTGPTFTQFFYGLGNTYVNYGERYKYHIVKGSQIRLAPSVEKRFGFGSRIFIKPTYQFLDLEDSHDDPRFVYTPASGLNSDDFGQRHYLGMQAGYAFERLDNAAFPSRGGEVGVSGGVRSSLEGPTITHTLLSAEGALYIPFNTSATIVLATHVQGDKIFGEYEFFHALTLGGPDKLRGFRRDRFAGEARVVHATDLRIKLLQSKGNIPFSLGVYGSFDYGRVWYEDSDGEEDQWHTAAGGGLYIAPFGLAGFRLGYMVGKEDRQINIGGSLRF